jgi:hypothetical protein
MTVKVRWTEVLRLTAHLICVTLVVFIAAQVVYFPRLSISWAYVWWLIFSGSSIVPST